MDENTRQLLEWGCPNKCKFKDVMCKDCVEGSYFDFDAQDDY